MSEIEKKPIKITETVLRDAHQSLIATRMTTEQMLPIIDKMDKVGYHAVECWGGATFDASLRFLKEDPWAVSSTHLNSASMNGRSGGIWTVVATGAPFTCRHSWIQSSNSRTFPVKYLHNRRLQWTPWLRPGWIRSACHPGNSRWSRRYHLF